MKGTVNVFRKIGNVYQHKPLETPLDKAGYRAYIPTMKFGSQVLEKHCSYDSPFLLGETSSMLGVTSPFSAVTNTECIIVSFYIKAFFKYITTASDGAISRFTDDCQARLNHMTEVAKNKVHGLVAA